MPKESSKSKKSSKSVASSSLNSKKSSKSNELPSSPNAAVDAKSSSAKSATTTSPAPANESNLHTSSSSCTSLAMSTTKNASVDGSLSSGTNNAVAVKSSHSRKDSRSNDKFHQLFPSVPIYETVIDTYSCAYVKSLNLFQGVMYLTSNYICFYSKILTSVNIIVLQWAHINSITKTMHALIFPTAICIDTQNSRYTFTSFRSRSHTYDNLIGLWNRSREQSLIRRQINMQRKQMEQQKLQQSEAAESKRQDDESGRGPSVNDKTNESGGESALRRELLADNSRRVGGPNCGYVLEGNGDLIRVQQFTDENYTDKLANARPMSFAAGVNNTSTSYQNYNHQNFFPYDMNFGDSNIVTISLRHNKTLLQKVKILIGLLIPGFFDISRIDALLPICFLMCVLLLLNAFVLLNKVNQVDDLFSELLLKREA